MPWSHWTYCLLYEIPAAQQRVVNYDNLHDSNVHLARIQYFPSTPLRQRSNRLNVAIEIV